MAFWNKLGYVRDEIRFSVLEEHGIVIRNHEGEGRLIDFSRTGFSFEFPVYYARGVEIKVVLDNASGELAKEISALGLSPLSIQIVWGTPSQNNGVYAHGAAFKNLNEHHAEKLLQLIFTYSRNTKEVLKSA